MARRPAALDVLLALALGVEMQVELFFVDAPRSDLLIARAALLALAGALAVRRRAPVIAAAVALVGPDRAGAPGRPSTRTSSGRSSRRCSSAYSLGAHAEGRQFRAGLAVLVVATPIIDPPRPSTRRRRDFLFVATILVGGPILLGRLVRARVQLNQALHEQGRGRRGRPRAPAPPVRSPTSARGSPASCTTWSATRWRRWSARRAPPSGWRARSPTSPSGVRGGRDHRARGARRDPAPARRAAPRRRGARVGAAAVARSCRATSSPGCARPGCRSSSTSRASTSPLPAGVDLTAYRVVQEALAGALQAPDARRAAVRLRYAADRARLEVTDVGDAAARPRAPAARHARARRALRRRPGRRAGRRLRLRGARAAAAGAVA